MMDGISTVNRNKKMSMKIYNLDHNHSMTGASQRHDADTVPAAQVWGTLSLAIGSAVVESSVRDEISKLLTNM